ncbi:DUF2264 domain-containing protein [Arachidicoccus sp.]|uniref:DUF2264 domain-containing protein n=1 Tax=Arachidicoccus sp. TaxID=1872624 RepID=UPI003D25F0BA
MKRIYLVLTLLLIAVLCHAQPIAENSNQGIKERSFLVETLSKIANPVLVALSKNELHKTMPVESSGNHRERYTHLEAFGRLLSGMAPWLELGPDHTQEGRLRGKYIALARKCLYNATDSTGADYMNFSSNGQPIVDAAFLAQGLLRAPNELWYPLNPETKANIIAALEKCSSTTHFQNNWVMFSATVEAALYKFAGTFHREETIAYIDKCLSYYKGDGTYGDGQVFHWDYYNSYVIQPMLLDVLKAIIETDSAKQVADEDLKIKYQTVLKRARRYAEIQEMMISPIGTYPVVGRSSTYRFGAFQLLSQIALWKQLPKPLQPRQVRAALYAVIKNQINAKGTFDKDNWLQIGVYGHQPNMGEEYISTGSLYLCSEAFLMLGLPTSDTFWQGNDKDWTSKKIWSSQNTTRDHSLN